MRKTHTGCLIGGCQKNKLHCFNSLMHFLNYQKFFGGLAAPVLRFSISFTCNFRGSREGPLFDEKLKSVSLTYQIQKIDPLQKKLYFFLEVHLNFKNKFKYKISEFQGHSMIFNINLKCTTKGWKLSRTKKKLFESF